MDKKNLGLYLIAASIVFASIIIYQTFKSSDKDTCFTIMYEELYEEFSKKEETLNKKMVAAANKLCQ